MKQSTIPRIEKMFHRFLRLHGFQETLRHDAGSFDSGFVEYHSATLGIRLVSDRGTGSVDIRANDSGADWFDLNLFEKMISGGDLQEARRPEDLLAFLQTSIDRVEQAFGKDDLAKTEASLRSIQSQRVRKMFPDAFK